MKLLRLKVVLAAIEYDEASLAVLDAARALAGASGATLHVVHVDATAASNGDSPSAVDGSSVDRVVALLARASLKPDDAQLHIIAGDPSHVIRSLADRIRADVIVLGPHREAADRERRIGSTALAIATSSWAPCLIVAGGLRLPLARVLVPVDLSDTARGALMVALSWSSALRGASESSAGSVPTTRLTAMYVDRSGSTSGGFSSATRALAAELDRVRDEAGTWAGVAVEGVAIGSTDIAGAIADRARADGAQLIVLGTRGLGLDAVGRLGSVSEAVMRSVDVPVLLVPPAVWTELAREYEK